MNVKLRVLSAGAIFFLGIAVSAQKKKADTTTKTNDIEEVVVLGTYGIKETQEQKVGSYSLVTSKTLEKPNALSVDMAIAGQVSGTIINANSGQPGSNAKVLIRGVSSLTGDNQPLYIVDGVPVLVGDQAGVATTSNALAMIDPTDIESVEVLKDGATTSIYGSRANAGVIIIKTKSGRGGKGKLTFMAEYGLGNPAFEKLKFQNAQETVNTLIRGYVDTKGQSLEDATNTVLNKEYGLLKGWDGVSNTDWEAATRRSAAASSKYNLNYSFGNERIKGYASVGNTEMEGITRDALYKRMNATIKLNAKVNDKISIVSSNMISRAVQNGPLDYGYFANPILSSRFTPNTNSVYNLDGSYNLKIDGGVGNAGFNPVALQDINKRRSSFTKILSSFGLDYTIIKNLRFSSNVGIDYNYYDENEYRNPDFGDGDNAANGITGLAIQSNYTYTTLNWSNFFNYDFKLNDDHKFTATAGSETTVKWLKYPYQASTGFKSGHYEQNQVAWGTIPFTASSYERKFHLIGYMARLSYGYRDYFNLMGSFRRDGYSHFGDNVKYGNFWASGANFNIHNIVDVSSVFDNLKVRASYGEVGNTGNVMYFNRATLGQSLYMLSGGYLINNPGNPDLQWESSKKSNIGIDLGFAGNKLKLSFDVYKNIINDQLTDDVPNAPSTGFGSLVGNLLKSESKGFESTFTYDAVQNKNFSWTINGNYSYTRAKVLEIGAPYLDVTYLKRYAVGHDPSEWFLANYIGVDHNNGDALWYTDSSHTTVSNGQAGSPTINRDYVGKKSIPTHTAGLTNSFTYKKFTLSFLATYAGDFSVYDLWGRYYDADGQDVGIKQVQDVTNSWSPINTSSDRPQYRPGNSVAKHHSTRYLYKGDYIKLKSAELGFRLNNDDLGVKEINSVYFYVRGINLLTFTFDKNLKFDPESNSNYVESYVGGSGIYDQTQPILRQVMFGAVIDF